MSEPLLPARSTLPTKEAIPMFPPLDRTSGRLVAAPTGIIQLLRQSYRNFLLATSSLRSDAKLRSAAPDRGPTPLSRTAGPLDGHVGELLEFSRDSGQADGLAGFGRDMAGDVHKANPGLQGVMLAEELVRELFRVLNLIRTDSPPA